MASLRFYGGIGEIGGNKILVEDSGHARIFLDFGRPLGSTGKYYDGFLPVRSKSGVRDLMKLGLLPRIDGIYRECLVNRMIDKNGGGKGMDVEWDAFKGGQDYFTADGIASYETWMKTHGEKPFVDGVFLTHAHFDHIQDISYLSPEIPVYCTRETALVARVLSSISNLKADVEYYNYNNPEIAFKKPHYRTVFPNTPTIDTKEEKTDVSFPNINLDFTVDNPKPHRNYVQMKDGAVQAVGSMKVKIIETDHSIPGACAYLITVDGKTILYTGDIRFHGTSGFTVDQFMKKIGVPVDVLIIEGTRIDSPTVISEHDVQSKLASEMAGVEGLVLVDFNWKDVQRFKTICTVANQAGRKFLIDPNLAFLLHELHLAYPGKYGDPLKMDGLGVYMKRQGTLLYSKTDYKTTDAGYLDEWGSTVNKENNNLKQIKDKLDKKQAITPDEQKAWSWATSHLDHGVRAYQVRAAPRNYVLMCSFWDMNELFDLSDSSGDLGKAKYIKASCEPFNDEMMVDERRLMNWLDRFHIKYEKELSADKTREFLKRNHASGHASRPELDDLIAKVKPRKLVFPVHTEHPDAFKDMVGAGVAVVADIEPGKEYVL